VAKRQGRRLPRRRQAGALLLGLAAAILAPPRGGTARADQLVADDLLVQGSGCIGFDCADNEAFGGDTLRLKENNLRIRFRDTSPAGLPRENWEMRVNDSTNGGRSYFAVLDLARGVSGFRNAPGTAVGNDQGPVSAVAVADFDGDGRPDLAVGRPGQTCLLYLNNGDASPFAGVSPTEIGAAGDQTTALLAADFDGDGRTDLVLGRSGQTNRLYLNNGTADPFAGVAGTDIGAEEEPTTSLARFTAPFHPGLSLVAGNYGQPNRLYLNNGTADPFAGVAGTAVGPEADWTTAVAADPAGSFVVAGNYDQPNRLYYVAPGPGDPFAGVTGVDLSADSDPTTSVAVANVDLLAGADVVVGNRGQPSRLFLDDGARFATSIGTALTAADRLTTAVLLADLNGDPWRVDLIVANDGQPNLVFANGGGAVPFGAGTEISGDAEGTTALATGDLDGDGLPDLVAGNSGAPTRLYPNRFSRPFAVAPDAPTDALHVDAAGRVGVGTGTPGAALDVAGDLHVRGDLEVTGAARGGFVKAADFRNGLARVRFRQPYDGDYVILLTAVARSAGLGFRPMVLKRGPGGFVLTPGGDLSRLRRVQWVTRAVGEY